MINFIIAFILKICYNSLGGYMTNIVKIVDKCKLGTIVNIDTFKSSQNSVYKVVTDKNMYVIKEYSMDAISSYYYLKKRKEQIKISEIFKKNSIDTIIPNSYNNQKFVYLNKHYYLIYDYYEQKNKRFEDLDDNDIKKLAYIQAKIHKLNIKSKLPCTYKKIKINLFRHKERIKFISPELYQILNDNTDKLNTIIDICNSNIKKAKENLCISHNDYKLLNIS